MPIYRDGSSKILSHPHAVPNPYEFIVIRHYSMHNDTEISYGFGLMASVFLYLHVRKINVVVNLK